MRGAAWRRAGLVHASWHTNDRITCASPPHRALVASELVAERQDVLVLDGQERLGGNLGFFDGQVGPHGLRDGLVFVGAFSGASAALLRRGLRESSVLRVVGGRFLWTANTLHLPLSLIGLRTLFDRARVALLCSGSCMFVALPKGRACWCLIPGSRAAYIKRDVAVTCVRRAYLAGWLSLLVASGDCR